MSHSCRKAFAPGFTLVEVLVVVATLGMILWMVGQLLFPMRQAAERQRLQVEARQTARAAADYLNFVVHGATDMNDLSVPRNPAAILTFVWQGNGNGGGTNPTCDGTPQNGCIQLSYNNVTDASLATPGTDIITLGKPSTPLRLHRLTWPGSADNSSPTWWSYDQGCPSDLTNKTMFDQATQRDPVTGWSAPLMLFDATGHWVFYQITDYKDTQNANCCSAPPNQCIPEGSLTPVPCIQVIANPGNDALNAPGGQRDLHEPVTLVIGVQYSAYRVCDGWLEQKAGVFNPATDNNCPTLAAGAPFPAYVTKPGWTPLLPNVEDLQFAYVFGSGAVWNGPAGTMPTALGVPVQVGGASPPPLDAENVTAIRVTVVARSSSPVTIGGGKTPEPRPVVEDHDPGVTLADTYYRSVISTTAMLRNRLAGF